MATDRRACGLADRAETIGDRDAGGDLEALARARAVGETVLERLLEPPQMIRLAEGELGLGAAQLSLLTTDATELRCAALSGMTAKFSKTSPRA